jgi:propanol-preferring alcohol dehydrogenase
MVLEQQGQPLRLRELPVPDCGADEVLVRVSACGICRTDLHVVDGDLTEPSLPLVPGHQVVGQIQTVGAAVTGFAPGDRVGVPWLGGSCGSCRYCASGRENLCDLAEYTGYQRDGGFAEYLVARPAFCFPLPAGFSDVQAAPLLCAGLIGYRAYRSVMDAGVLSLYGFGAAAHILVQVARHRGQTVYAYTREGDSEAQRFARELGATWAGASGEPAPGPADAAIIFAPVGELVPEALRSLRKGGKVVCAGIHMSDIPTFPYAWLWGERSIESVANLTRRDGEEFLPLAAEIPVATSVSCYPLERVNEALSDLRDGRLIGAGVIDLSLPA